MIQLNFKPFNYKFKFKELEQKTYIFDRVRKKYIQCTPEEWVRQNVIAYLVEEKGFSLALIAVERGLYYNNMNKRYDLKVYNPQMELVLLVECKAPNVKLTQETFLQSLTYAQKQTPQIIMLSNGLHHIYYNTSKKSFVKDFQLIKS